VSTITYDAAGRPATTTDALARAVSFGYGGMVRAAH
jgi:YD repeat-containing protein